MQSRYGVETNETFLFSWTLLLLINPRSKLAKILRLIFREHAINLVYFSYPIVKLGINKQYLVRFMANLKNKLINGIFSENMSFNILHNFASSF